MLTFYFLQGTLAQRMPCRALQHLATVQIFPVAISPFRGMLTGWTWLKESQCLCHLHLCCHASLIWCSHDQTKSPQVKWNWCATKIFVVFWLNFWHNVKVTLFNILYFTRSCSIKKNEQWRLFCMFSCKEDNWWLNGLYYFRWQIIILICIADIFIEMSEYV